jgi:uroporphyrinogen-III synthase
VGDARPLVAVRVVVTRPASQSAELMEKLRAAGAVPVAAPAIEILPAEDDAPLLDAVQRLDDYGWIVFTSANAVNFFGQARFALGTHHVPLRAAVAAVGTGTAAACAKDHLAVAFQPSAALGETLARELPIEPGQRVLWPRGSLAPDTLADILRERGAVVDSPVVYRTVTNLDLLGIVDAMRDRRIDALTFTSPSTVRHFVDGLAAAGVRLARLPEAERPRIACIGPVTAAAARECGLTVDALADPSSDDGLVAALVRIFSARTDHA